MTDEHPQSARRGAPRGVAGWTRTAVFALLFGWMVAGPFYYQVLGQRGKLRRYIRPWIMFSLRGIGFVEARFFEHMPDGTLRELDRYALLGYRSRADAPQGIRRIPNQERTYALAKKLCRKLGPRADVRVISNMATVRGWRPQYRGTEKICR